jgi:Tol biopolymer transport system component
VSGFAKWDGRAWSGLDLFGQPSITALASDGESIYVAGRGLATFKLPDLQSKSLTGGVGNSASGDVAISGNGRWLAFSSNASNLTAADSNGRADVFVRDLVSGTTARVSASAEAVNGGALESFADPAVSADGARVAFAGSSGQLYASIGGQGRVISRSAAGALGNGPSGKVDLPGTGNLAFFDSQASNLLAGVDGNGSIADIFVTDLATGAVSLVTQGPNGEPANGASSAPSASADGQWVAFSSLATNIVPGTAAAAGNGKSGTVQQAKVMGRGGFGASRILISRNRTTGAEGNGDSINVRLTRDGRFGVFESLASNLVDGDTNNARDIFRFEIANNAVARLERVSVSTYGVQSNGASKNASISDDGQFITFETDATNLIELDRNGTTDILVKWMVTGEVVRLSRTVDGEQPNGPSVQPVISGDGGAVAFASGATNLTPADSNNATDAFSVDLRDSGPALVTGPQDEPGLAQFALPAPSPANASCPSGFFSAVVDDGPGSGLTAGAFGMELLLDEPGTRVLAGGLNFGGLIDAGQVGFAGFTIANPANESQRLNLSLTGSPSSSSTQSLPVRIRIARRTETTSETVFESTQTISLASPYVTSIDLPPAFYEATVAPVSGAAGGIPEGQFFFSLTTSFINRPGGGFQGGAVVGGYHAAHPFGGVSGFAAFCLATPHSTSIRVLSRPSYGPTGAQDLRLRIQDAQQRDVVVVPAG